MGVVDSYIKIVIIFTIKPPYPLWNEDDEECALIHILYTVCLEASARMCVQFQSIRDRNRTLFEPWNRF